MITGGCECGAVRYSAGEEPVVSRVCWCRVCQKIGAGGGTVNAIFKTASLVIDGVLRNYASLADSGNRVHRRFCPQCGTHVFSQSEARPHLIVVRAGTLDDPEIARPAATIWTGSAPSWACIDPALPKIEGQPPPAA
ncbi:MAG TPA: GFA family protein [Candidatus Binatia bacterium]|nr:GFA family protein [Candidatus Binatia bacterium]